MKEILTIFKYVDGENDELFYSSAEPIKLYEYSFSSTRMGSATISSTLLFPVCLDNLWSGKEYVLFRGTRYFIKNTPSSTKDNTSALYTHSLEFAPETELQLSNVYFIDAVYSGSDVDDKIKTNSTKVIFFGTLAEFATRIEKAISYSGLSGYSVTIDEGITTDTQQVSFEDRTIFEVLQDSFEIYGVPFYFIGKAIHFGHTDNDISQPFKYGVNNELLSIKKNNANYKIVTRITGTGGERNIPYYYPNNSPKGNIKAQALSSNTAITQADINLVNAEKFSNKVDLGASVVYYHGTESVQSWTVNGVPDSGGLHNVTIPRYGPVVEKYVFQLSILSAGIFKISFDMWIQYVGTVYPIGDLISRYELKNKDTGDSLSLTPIDSDKTTGYFLTPWLAEGDYELEIDFTLRFQGHQEYTYSLTPNINSDYGWAIIATDGSGKVVELNDIGVEIIKTPSIGDGFTQVSVGSMPASTVLLPPIYRETSGEERFYDAENNTYVIPGTEDYYQFENQISDSYPKEHIFSDDSIYPTINGITNASGQEIGRFLQVAFDENDNDETVTSDDGSTENYVHPYFFVKLPKFDGSWGFNLFDHAIESGEMEIVMTSGNCNGCHFVIGVDESSQKNLVQVDASGNLLRDKDGDVRCGRDGKPGETPQDRQNDTRNNEVWIALKKDISTFGVIMPNAAKNYRPLAADKFVIINILLPQAYIKKAENELKEAIIKYMAENNSEKFNFSVSFSRIYLATHPEIAGLIDENARLRITYNEATYPFYVSQYTYKAIADESLPEIGVELSEAITVNKGILQNTVDEIKGDISKINTSIDPAQSMRSYFLLKNQNDETSGIVRFISGILLGSASSSNSYGFNINNLGGVDGILSNLTLYGGSQNGNTALNLVNGVVAGLRHTVKRITGDATLTSDDYIVLASSESAATITLPEIPQNGQMYRIYSTSAAGITIYGNGRPIYRTGSTVALTQSVISASSGLVDIFYSFSGGGWYLSAPDTELFELVNIGTEESPLMAIKAKYGLFSNSFISARGSDPDAGSGGSGTGLDVDTLWQVLGGATSEQINATHIPSLSISKITGLQDALDSKLEGITKGMVEAVLTGTVTSHNHDGRYAPLSGGLIPSQYLPSYVDDVVEYASMTAFPATGEAGKIYVALDTNLTYRWGGSSYVEISPSLALGHTSGTAYPGDEGAALAERVEAMKAITDLFGIDADGHVYVTGNRGFYGNSFISARGSDPEAGSGGGGGLDVQAMWYALGQPTSEKINVSHIPAIGMDKVSGLTDALAGKLSGITGEMVKDALGYTPYDASQIGSASVKYAASAGKVAHALTIYNDGGSSSASAKTYNGSAAVTINIPTTLPASDVYSWAKQPVKPSYTFSEIGSKPSTLSGYGITDGVNAAEAAGHLTVSVSGHKLTIGVASGYTIPTASQITLWNKICALFDVDTEGNVYVTGSKGFWSNSFISARGSDPEAGSGGGGGGLDVQAMWYALGQPTGEKINVSHIPLLQQLSGTLTNAQLANSSLSVAGVSVALGGAVSTEQIAGALGLGSNAYTSTAYLPLAGGTMTGALSVNSYIYSPKGLFGLTEEQADSYAGKAYYNLAVGQKSPSMGASLLLYRDSTSYQSYIGWSTETQDHIGIGLAADANDLIIENHKAGIQIKGTGNLTYNNYPLLHSGNYTNYTVTKTGTGASGTWPISVSGTAAYATVLSSNSSTPVSNYLQYRQINGQTSLVGSNAVNGAWCLPTTGGDAIYGNGQILRFGWAQSYYTDLHTGPNEIGSNSGLQFRQVVAGAVSSLGWRTLLDTANYATLIDSRYVKKSGDTMTGTLTFPTATNAYDSLAVRFSGVSTRIGVDAAGGLGLYAQDALYLRPSWTYGGTSYGLIIKSSNITYNGHPIWHSGNDGAGSGLDADTLDGYHGSSSNTTYTYVLRNSKAGALVNEITFPLVNFPKDDPPRANISPMSLRVWDSYKQSVVGGDTYGTVLEFCARRSHWNHQLYFQAYGHNIWHRASSYNDSSWAYGWVKLATVNDNVASATKLATGRLLWGRSFDGSGDIRGNIIVGDAIIHGSVTSNNTRFISSDNASNIYFSVGGLVDLVAEPSCLRRGASNTSETLGTSTYRWANVYAVNGDYSGNMTVSGWINNALILSQKGVSADNSDTTTFRINGHVLEFGGRGHAHQNYYFRPQYSASGVTYADMYIQNASAADSPVFSTTHAFYHNGNAYHYGNLGLGTAAPQAKLDVIGTIRATMGISSNGYVSAKGQDTTSDARYKRDIAALPAQAALAVLMRLRPSTWAWKDDGRRGAGFIAQEVMGVLPEAVREVGGGEDRHLALNYQMLHAYEVSALQTHESELERLRDRVLLLENEIKRIRHGS